MKQRNSKRARLQATIERQKETALDNLADALTEAERCFLEAAKCGVSVGEFVQLLADNTDTSVMCRHLGNSICGGACVSCGEHHEGLVGHA